MDRVGVLHSGCSATHQAPPSSSRRSSSREHRSTPMAPTSSWCRRWTPPFSLLCSGGGTYRSSVDLRWFCPPLALAPLSQNRGEMLRGKDGAGWVGVDTDSPTLGGTPSVPERFVDDLQAAQPSRSHRSMSLSKRRISMFDEERGLIFSCPLKDKSDS